MGERAAARCHGVVAASHVDVCWVGVGLTSRSIVKPRAAHALLPLLTLPRRAGVARAVFKRGVGVSVLSQYLREANTQAEVWLQVRFGEGSSSCEGESGSRLLQPPSLLQELLCVPEVFGGSCQASLH